jgi:hypothetical protein
MPRRFDERPALCHNQGPVQPPRSVLRLALLAWLGLAAPAAAGCAKPHDQPLLQQEVLATAGDYDRRLDELQQRADELDRRRRALPHDTLDGAPAEHRLAQARSAIEDRRGYLQGVRARLAGGKPGAVRELQVLLDELRARLDGGVVEATADLQAVDSWVAAAAQLQRAGAQPPATEPEPRSYAPAPAAPAAPPASGDRAVEIDRSGAPIR